jgi:hypothetical protein
LHLRLLLGFNGYVVLPPPTLQGLLNPAPSLDGPGDANDYMSESAPTTTAEEMYYGLVFDEGASDDDESEPITFI